MAHFTEEQLKELETLFGLKRMEEDVLPVRDGYVNKNSMVWWRKETGPIHAEAGSPDHWANIKSFPNAYQLKKPTIYYAD